MSTESDDKIIDRKSSKRYTMSNGKTIFQR